jgi:hypothetical protein
MKLVAGITTKNEEWIINKTLNVLSKFCDKIIILDDNSEDKTLDICKKFEKVEIYKRKLRKNIWERKEAEGLNELFKLCGKYNPEYIMMLDADEIPTPNFLKFFHTIDKKVSAWSVRMINLQPDDKHYRVDKFKTGTGALVNHNPFDGNGWRKVVLTKYNKNFDYSYNMKVQKGGTSKNHPSPQNIPGIIKNTESFYVIHYGKLNKTYTSGEKDKFYALIESHDGKGSYQQRLNHHKQCRTGGTPIIKKINPLWIWK